MSKNPYFWGNESNNIHTTPFSFKKPPQTSIEVAQLEQVKRQLEVDIENLKAEKIEKEKRFAEAAESEMMFERWYGLSVDECTRTSCQVSFCPEPLIPKPERYSVGFQKNGAYWRVSNQALPFCVRNLHERVAAAQIDDLAKLSSMIRDLQMDIIQYHRRRKQFEEAKTLPSDAIQVYPSVDTTSLMLELELCDNTETTDMRQATIHLTYLPEKVLPEEPLFEFQGGDKASQEELRRQLACLEIMPLKEALMSAFNLNSSGDISTGKDESLKSAAAVSPTKKPELDVSLTESEKSLVKEGRKEAVAKMNKKSLVRDQPKKSIASIKKKATSKMFGKKTIVKKSMKKS